MGRGRGERRWEGERKRGGERGKLKSFELNPTIRTEVMVKKRFSNLDLYLD